MHRHIAPLVLVLAATLTPGVWAQARAPQPGSTPPAGAPTLVVLIVIDQFRADYVDMYGTQWTKGLRRLLDAGAVFTNAAYPYAATYTCAGHATIGTGAFPATHGMSGNTFYDRSLRRSLPCAFDGDATSVAFAGGAGRERHSARSLLVPTFAEELRRQAKTPPQIVAVGMKPRTAVTLAGKGGPGTIVVWEEDDGTWATSDAFTKTTWPDVDEFVRTHPINGAYGEVWNLLLPPSTYRYTDDGAGESRNAPWTRTFPHPIISAAKKPNNEFVTAWEKSPLDDAFLTDLAIHLLKSRRLGTGTATDVLAMSLPTLDLSGHDYGPRSFEVQDVLLRLDANLGRLLDALDQQVGANYTLALSSDHGVALMPEQVTAEGGDAGRISATAVRNAVNAAVEHVLGVPGPHVGAVYEHQVALIPGEFDRLRVTPGGVLAVTQAIASMPGVAAAYSSDDLIGTAETSDPGIRAWRLSYVPGRSGDFMFTPRPNWILQSTAGTTHGTLNTYDQRVPLILFGRLVQPGRYDAAVTPADIAPTFAALTGVTLARAQGHPLTSALIRR